MTPRGLLGNGLIGQGIYTSAKQTLEGIAGYGFVALSPSLREQLTWLSNNLAETLSRHVPATIEDREGLRRRVLVGRTVIPHPALGPLAALILMSGQGRDARGREDSYVAQFLVGGLESLPASLVTSLDVDSPLFVQPDAYTDGFAAAIGDLLPSDLDLLPADKLPVFRGGDARRLIEDLSGARVFLPIGDEVAAVGLLRALGDSWDSGSMLELTSKGRFEYKLSLNANPVVDRFDLDLSGRDKGDVDWAALRAGLEGVDSLDSLRARLSPETVVEDDVAQSSVPVLSPLQAAVGAYLLGDGTDLERLLRADRSVVANASLDMLARERKSVIAYGLNSASVNLALLEQCEGEWGRRNSLSSILPSDSSSLERLGSISLGPMLLRHATELVLSKPSSAGTVRFRSPNPAPGLINTVRDLWDDSETRSGIQRIVALAGAGDAGLLAALMRTSPESPENRSFVFGDIIPHCFPSGDACPFLNLYSDEFMRWVGLDEYYWEVIRFDRRGRLGRRRLVPRWFF